MTTRLMRDASAGGVSKLAPCADGMPSPQTASELLTKAKRRLSGAQEFTFIVPWPP